MFYGNKNEVNEYVFTPEQVVWENHLTGTSVFEGTL